MIRLVGRIGNIKTDKFIKEANKSYQEGDYIKAVMYFGLVRDLLKKQRKEIPKTEKSYYEYSLKILDINLSIETSYLKLDCNIDKIESYKEDDKGHHNFSGANLDGPDEYYKAGISSYMFGNYEEAEVLVKQADLKEPKVYKLLALIYMQNKDWNQVLFCEKKALELLTGNMIANQDMFYSYPKEITGLKVIEQIDELMCTNSRIEDLYCIEENHEEAEKSFNRVIAYGGEISRVSNAIDRVSRHNEEIKLLPNVSPATIEPSLGPEV
ncbi:MAG TPA: hypothetical protein DCP90_09395 [Clostridiales bacterium]|nr:MAG: hypothetical protein A2Y22_01460 [Clostridiales bacterium GWD2_32_59]HAN10807.1 hypothetical protein [Clostridiales bacterium]